MYRGRNEDYSVFRRGTQIVLLVDCEPNAATAFAKEARMRPTLRET